MRTREFITLGLGMGVAGCRASLCGFALIGLLGGCAALPPPTVTFREPLITGCPMRSMRVCDVIGGNKFNKRYGRCVCAAR